MRVTRPVAEEATLKRFALILIALVAILPAAPAGACPALSSLLGSDCDDEKPKRPRKPSATAAERAELSLFAELNRARARDGLPGLASSGAARSVARSHARRMADHGAAYHNPELRSSATRAALGYPRALGENVGHGPAAASIHQAFLDSPRHRANLLYAGYSAVGVGVIKEGRTYYAVEVFLGGAASWTGSGQVSAGAGRRRRSSVASQAPFLPAERPVPGRHEVSAATTSALPWRGMGLALVGLAAPGLAQLGIRRSFRRSR